MKSILGEAVRKAIRLTSLQTLATTSRAIRTTLSGSPRHPAQLKSVDIPETAGAAKPAEAEALADLAQLQERAAASLADALKVVRAGHYGDTGGVVRVLQEESTVANPADGTPKASPIGKVVTLLRTGIFPGLPLVLKQLVRPHPEVVTPRGAQFLSRTFSCVAGSRDYKLFIPSKRKGKVKGRKLPLILMLHGCTQNPDDFALGTGMNELAEERGCLVAYPKQSTCANQMGCWNWFSLKDQLRDSGEPRILAGMTRSILAEFKADPDRVFVAGLSAGGAMAAILGATYPDIFAAVGIHSGLAYGAANDAVSAISSMRNGGSVEGALVADESVRTIVFHGDEDHTVNPANADLIVSTARAGLEDTVENEQWGRSAGGVAYKRTVIADSNGAPQIEYWAIEGMGHGWSGGHRNGSFTNPHGPDASREMLRFFLALHPASRRLYRKRPYDGAHIELARDLSAAGSSGRRDPERFHRRSQRCSPVRAGGALR